MNPRDIEKNASLYEEYKTFLNATTLKGDSAIGQNYIFHYTDATGLLGILRSDSIYLWLSKHDCLNDRSEGQDITNQYHYVCRELRSEGKLKGSEYSKIVDLVPDDRRVIFTNRRSPNLKPLNPNDPEGDLFSREPIAMADVVETDCYLCCFSQGSDLLPMWNYYSNGNQYRGYNIGFDVKISDLSDDHYTLPDGKEMEGCDLALVKVIYDEVEKRTKLRRRITDILEFCGKESAEEIV